jgi:hypothetical protein
MTREKRLRIYEATPPVIPENMADGRTKDEMLRTGVTNEGRISDPLLDSSGIIPSRHPWRSGLFR